MQTLTGDLATRTGERDRLQTEVAALGREVSSAREELAAPTERADEVSGAASATRASS